MSETTTIAVHEVTADCFGSVLSLPTPLARLQAAAKHVGIDVVDHADAEHGPWPVQRMAAFVFEDCIALAPDLDDGQRADLIAFGVAVIGCMEPGSRGPGCITAPAGYVAVTRHRIAEPLAGAGRLARLFAEQCGRPPGQFVTFDVVIPDATPAPEPASQPA